jgi:hypothetical protein
LNSQARNVEPETQAGEIRLRAERRAGQLLKERDMAKPGPLPADRSQRATCSALIEFLTQALARIRGEDQVRAIALASLRLAEAVAKGGSYTFDNPDVSVARQEGRIVATARASVEEPGRGQVTIQMQFGPDGMILPDGVNIEDRTSRGPPSRS